MDSDDDGAYGYDMPEDSGPGFSLGGSKPSRRLGGDNDSSGDDANNSSDDDNFAYGAYGARKRKKRERQSNATDKERNLYGVFYESSDEERGPAGRGGKRSRHFDKRSNRQAGLAFVKASSSAAPSKEAEKGDVDGKRSGDGGDTKARPNREGAPEEPGWLKDTSDKKSGGAADDDAEMGEAPSDDKIEEEEDALDEEELKIIDDQEKRFNDLLAVATTSKTPLSAAKPTTQRTGGANSAVVPPANMDDSDAMFEDRGAAGLGLGFGSQRQTDGGMGSGPQSAATGIGFAAGGGAESKSLENGSAGLGSARSGLGQKGGLGLGSIREPPGQHEQSGGLGLGGMGGGIGSGVSGMGGLGSNFPSFGQGGMGLGLGHGSQPAKKKDPNLGKWEKHTKGIGMKLLQKMGYEGSGGLGAKRRRPAVGSLARAEDSKEGKAPSKEDAATGAKDKEEGPIKKGISRPVEVVVRPNGLGLGFGNFKEQSQLKVNRQIEAEVRGLELPKEETKKKEKGEKGIFDGVDKSLLPSTESLLNRGASSWRKGKGSKKAKRKIINYQDILNESSGGDGKMKIIDMRGAPTESGAGKEPTSSSHAVALGEELLHNVTLLLNTHEGQLRTASYMVKSTEQKIASLEAECQEMVDRKEGIKERSSKMKLALGAIGEAEQLIDKVSSMKKDGRMSNNDVLDFAMDSLRGILANLYSNFSREERKSLKFDTTLVPSIVKPLVESLTSTLDPLKMDLSWLHRFASGAKKLCDAVGSNNEAYALREMIFLQSIVPWVQRSLSSSKWDPAMNVETGLRLYEALLKSAVESFPGAEQDEDDTLKESITDEVVQKTALPKLLRAVGHWKPRLDGAQQVANPLHLWILPWLPYINNDSTLGTLLDDARRNLKKTVSFLSKSVSDDVRFIRSCIDTLCPWKRLFNESIFEMTSNIITPRLARSLARVKISISATKQEWDLLRVLFDFYEKGLMSRGDFLCLIEGEVLPSWANALYGALKRKECDMKDCMEFYIAWKRLFFIPSANTLDSATSPQLALRSDAMVCRHFYGGLEMIQAGVATNNGMLESLAPPHPADCNYRISLMRRSKDERGRDTYTSSAVGAKVRPKVRIVGTKEASFQEVVEEFAHQHDVAFVPKTGSGAMKDGKPVFLFGGHPVFMDRNVLFAKRGSSWQPISLEHLLQSC